MILKRKRQREESKVMFNNINFKKVEWQQQQQQLLSYSLNQI